MKIKYAKPHLTLDGQIEKLQQRGMGGDPEFMRERLASVSYYRISGYCYPHRQTGSDQFKPGTEFRTIWDHYVFDRRLRLLVLDAIERIEVAVRTTISYYHSEKHGSFGYAKDTASLNFKKSEDNKFFDSLNREKALSEERFVQHYLNTYTEPNLPIWMATEILSLGNIVRLYQACSRDIRVKISNDLGAKESVLGSWLLSLNTVRNQCAHHGRLWNRELPTKPLLPNGKGDDDWKTPVAIKPNKLFPRLTICQYLLSQICAGNHWGTRLRLLLNEYPQLPIHWMGFPENWLDSPIWERALLDADEDELA